MVGKTAVTLEEKKKNAIRQQRYRDKRKTDDAFKAKNALRMKKLRTTSTNRIERTDELRARKRRNQQAYRDRKKLEKEEDGAVTLQDTGVSRQRQAEESQCQELPARKGKPEPPPPMSGAQKWAAFVRRTDLMSREVGYLNKNRRLCQEHFDDMMFMNTTEKNKLTHFAMPSLVDIQRKPTTNAIPLKRPPLQKRLNCGNLECSGCDEFAHPYLVKRHPQKHIPNTCSDCGMGFGQPNHMWTLHQINQTTLTAEQRNVCSDCGHAFAKLKNHIFRHTEEKPHVCSDCGKGFKNRVTLSSINKHLWVHREQIPKVCSNCGEPFSRVGALTEDSRVYRVYVCYGCDSDQFSETDFVHSQLPQQSIINDSYESNNTPIQGQSDSESEFTRCALCITGFWSVDKLKEHLLSHYYCNAGTYKTEVNL